MAARTGLTSDIAAPTHQPGAGRLILCEQTGAWAVALRRELAGSGERCLETRSPRECWETLALSPASFVVVELTRSNLSDVLGRVGALRETHPFARAAVVARRSLASCEWVVREAGAVHFGVSPRALRLLAGVALRHLKSIPKRELSFSERIWSELPWKPRS